MSNKSTSQQIRNALAYCTGTEFWYRHPLARSCLYTDGVKMFAEMAGAYWFIDILATELIPLQRTEEFMSVKMTVTGSKASIIANDGNGRQVWSREIDFTDCPEGEWSFFVMNNTIIVPSEY